MHDFRTRSLKIKFETHRKAGEHYAKKAEVILVQGAHDVEAINQRKKLSKIKAAHYNKASTVIVQLNRLGLHYNFKAKKESKRWITAEPKDIRKMLVVRKKNGSKREFLKEMPLSELSVFANHRRMKLFVAKGFTCANPACGRIGTRLIVNRNVHSGKLHPDI